MSRHDEEAREKLRLRYLDLALEEILAKDGEPEIPHEPIRVADPRRPVRWVAVLAAACVLIAALPLLWPGSGEEIGAGLDRVHGVVLLPKGDAAVGATVRLELGWASRDLPGAYTWLSAGSRTTTTDDRGEFSFEELPEGATGLVFASRDGNYARAPAADRLTLELAATGRIRGRVLDRSGSPERLRVGASGEGWREARHEFGRPEEDGDFELDGLPPGPAWLYVSWGNWTLARLRVTVPASGEVDVGDLEVDAEVGYLPSPDPLLDVGKARLVDERGHPVPGVRLVWSSPWADGATASDEDGEVLLVGGGVRIGDPPFYLRLGHLEGPPGEAGAPARAYAGALDNVIGDTAVIRLIPLRTLSGEVRIGGEPVEEFALLFRVPGAVPRLYRGRAEEGRYSIQLPPGRGELFLLTVDGKRHALNLEVPSGDGSIERDLEFEEDA
jgi:hypothetical protein